MTNDDKIVEAIQQFMAITGLKDENEALNMLQMTNFQVEEALNIFLMNNNQTENTNNGFEDDYVDETSLKRFRSDDILDEEGRRVIPDDVKRQRLVDYPDPRAMMHMHPQRGFIQARELQERNRSVFGATASFKPKSSKEATLHTLYAPPNEIILHANFLSAREIAKSQKRWLLVNINDNENFSSHVLNRDVWKDDGVQNLIQIGYIFWQQLMTDPEGQTFVERYKVTQYPYVAIIDPRTGSLLCDLKQKLSLDAVCEKLTDYLYSNPYPDDSDIFEKKPAANMKADSSSRTDAVHDDDDDVAAAIALSLAEASKAPEPVPSSSSSSSSPARGFSVSDAQAYTPSSSSTDIVKLQFRLPHKRIQQSFPIHDDIKIVASHVASELQAADIPQKTSSFEMYLTFPRLALSVAMNSMLSSSAQADRSSSNLTSNPDDLRKDANMNGLEASGVVSLWSLGITKDTAIAVEFI